MLKEAIFLDRIFELWINISLHTTRICSWQVKLRRKRLGGKGVICGVGGL